MHRRALMHAASSMGGQGALTEGWRHGCRQAMGSLACALALYLAACAPVAVSTPTVEVARSSGLKQCGEEVPAPEAYARELETSGVKVFSSACASDGLLRAQVCGQDRGLYYVYQIDARSAAKAHGLGFTDPRQISGNPGYRRFACPQDSQRCGRRPLRAAPLPLSWTIARAIAVGHAAV